MLYAETGVLRHCLPVVYRGVVLSFYYKAENTTKALRTIGTPLVASVKNIEALALFF